MSQNTNEHPEIQEDGLTKRIKDSEKIPVDEESKYNAAIRRLELMYCVSEYNAKIEMYEDIAQQFSKISGYKDANKYAEECRNLAGTTFETLNKELYSKALIMKNTAKQAQEYSLAAEEFRKLGNYRDSEALAAQCESISTKVQKTVITKIVVKTCILIFIIATAVIFANTSYAKYYYANFCKLAGSYHNAIQLYEELGVYKDCEEKLIESRYRYALKAEKAENYPLAIKEYAAAGAYKDSANKKVMMEKLAIRNSQIGDYLRIGKSDWIILALEDNKALLIKKVAIKRMAYHDNTENVTWEISSLRIWLNSEFLENSFSEEEQKQIILTKLENENNPLFETKGGNATQDYLFILSIEEAESYQTQLTELKYNSWLRTPGSSQNCVAFISPSRTIMNYGYAATGNEMAAYPLMWFSLE